MRGEINRLLVFVRGDDLANQKPANERKKKPKWRCNPEKMQRALPQMDAECNLESELGNDYR